jgi:hypothetical protein
LGDLEMVEKLKGLRFGLEDGYAGFEKSCENGRAATTMNTVIS